MNEYNDNQSFFKQLLQTDHSVTVDHKNVQFLTTEIFRLKNIPPKSMKVLFELKEPQKTDGQN